MGATRMASLEKQDIISMPDKWEYPWYAAWDLAFHCIPMAKIDPGFAKNQLILIMREWYMKPDGQLPAYEWHFSDVNPPVQAWAALQVYQDRKNNDGQGDINFLKRVFQKLIINFTWWINRKDARGNNIFRVDFWGLIILVYLTGASKCRANHSWSRLMAPAGWECMH